MYQRQQAVTDAAHRQASRRSGPPLFNLDDIPIATNCVRAMGIPRKWYEARKRFLEEVPRRIDGLNLQRVEHFILERGLTLGEYSILDSSDSAVSAIILSDLETPIFPTELRAVYLSSIDLVLVERRRALEAVNSPVITEGLLIHELGHASSHRTPKLFRRVSPFALSWKGYQPRIGFGRHWDDFEAGMFLEEGFCDALRGTYLSELVTADHIERIKSIPGISLIEDRAVRVQEVCTGFMYLMPLKYLEMQKDGSCTFSVSALAGLAMELIWKKDSALREAMWEARSDTAALYSIPRLMDHGHAGIYRFLFSLKNTEADFMRGLRAVIDSFYDGKQPVI